MGRPRNPATIGGAIRQLLEAMRPTETITIPDAFLGRDSSITVGGAISSLRAAKPGAKYTRMKTPAGVWVRRLA